MITTVSLVRVGAIADGSLTHVEIKRSIPHLCIWTFASVALMVSGQVFADQMAGLSVN